jgi:hypothetical protein
VTEACFTLLSFQQGQAAIQADAAIDNDPASSIPRGVSVAGGLLNTVINERVCFWAAAKEP